MDIKKDWRIFLAKISKSETEIAKEVGLTQQSLNRRINNKTIKYDEISKIVEKYGYSVKIHKEE